MKIKYRKILQKGLSIKLSSEKYAFCLGFLICFIISSYIILFNSRSYVQIDNHQRMHTNELFKQIYELTKTLHSIEVKNKGQDENFNVSQNTVIADLLSKEVKILCWVMTNPENHATKAKAVKETWGKRCNKLLFMSTELDSELNTIALNVAEGRDFLWSKTKEAFRYIYRYYLDDYDWFYKADDDTYAIIENLRFMLHAYSANMPIYFGCKFKPFVSQGYMSGGAGYVLSREALRRFAETGIHDDHACNLSDQGVEDLEMGRCMEKLNVTAGDSRDELEKSKFFFANAEYAIFPAEPGEDWTTDYAYYGLRKGFNCCSDNAIAFHYIDPHGMYSYEYLIYHLHPFGIINLPQLLPKKVNYEIVAELNKGTTTTESYNTTEASTLNSSTTEKDEETSDASTDYFELSSTQATSVSNSSDS